MTDRFKVKFVASVALLATAALVAASPIQKIKCPIFVQSKTSQELREAARSEVQRASVVVDAVVVRPYVFREQDAVIRAVHLLKGIIKIEYEVGVRDRCSLALDRIGERARMLLIGGPDVFYLEADQSNARYEDELLGSDRRRIWPYRQGRAAIETASP